MGAAPSTTMVMGPDMNRDGIPDFMQGGAYGGFGGVPATTMAAPAMGYPTTTMSYAAPSYPMSYAAPSYPMMAAPVTTMAAPVTTMPTTSSMVAYPQTTAVKKTVSRTKMVSTPVAAPVGK